MLSEDPCQFTVFDVTVCAASREDTRRYGRGVRSGTWELCPGGVRQWRHREAAESGIGNRIYAFGKRDGRVNEGGGGEGHKGSSGPWVLKEFTLVGLKWL